MSDVHIPYLCGGTFFFLLLQAKYTKTTSPQDYISGTKEDMVDRHIMNKLVYSITGKNSYCIDSTLKKDTLNNKCENGCDKMSNHLIAAVFSFGLIFRPCSVESY